MRGRVTIAGVAVASSLAVACSQSPPPLSGPERPNIVILLADDLGYCDAGLYSCEDIPTPNIQRLADGGVLFTDAYVTAGTCSPSRAALLTGRYQQRFGFEFNTGFAQVTFDERRGLPPDEETVATLLEKAGYATGLIGKWHLGNTEGFHPTDRGFDEFFGFLVGGRSYFDGEPDGTNAASRRFKPDDPRAGVGLTTGLNQLYRGRAGHTEGEYLTDAFAREAEDFIDRHQDHPFLLYVAFNAPHTPIEATTEYVERFRDEPEDMRRTYMGMVSALDDAVGRVLAKLDTLGLAENTLVVFLSDNGCLTKTGACVNDPLRLGKAFLFEGGIRIPFALRFPSKVEGGRIYRNPVSSLDLFPTIASLAGVSPAQDREYDGVDLMPFLIGENEAAPHGVLYWRNGSNKAIRKGHWKLFWNDRKDWLFDLSSDIGELDSLADREPEVVEELKHTYRTWESGMAQPAWPARPGGTHVVDGVVIDVQL